jgi:hypothetical protein
MQDVPSRMQFCGRMRTRINSAKISNVNMGPWRGAASRSKGLPGPRYFGGVRIQSDEIRSTHSRGVLFAEYINTFLKLKAEASGYPAWVRTPEVEERYVTNYDAREGVLMDREAIRPNPAKRGLAKLCLNSLWGKLAEAETNPEKADLRPTRTI